ncbi:hypothetical protein L226DRAFT_614050 [Lentinus tigrinus ALCF2SS1-7]|uniref:F-box domain-containing protein n=1 Tax=Lentinus tigrinus ALCF2SS1-6 TaxID=1328759 RepID=A0A5C2S655_9APHY|nr:hypothetical protein L227DRAFT_654219 [Lentinus tigrinus ALCF2SS1-6]RPD73539.1 hypothetical protein L226DRAFT_614050 [Lentinus tigrinus ALCF2SS1-7]
MLLVAYSEFLTRLFLDVWSTFRDILSHTEGISLYDRLRTASVTLGAIPEPPLPFLPLELEYMILEHLQYDRRTLQTCSLVCKDWQPTAHSYLFRELYASGKEKLETLPWLLSSAPDIRWNVQSLVLSGARLDADSFISLRALMKLIANLPNLCELEVADIPFSIDPGVVDMPHRQSLHYLRLAASHCKKDNFFCLMNIISLFSSIIKVELSAEDDVRNPMQEALPPPEQLVQEGLIPSGGPVEIHALEALEIEPHWLPILYASLRALGALSSTMPGIELSLSYDIISYDHALSIDDENELHMLITGYGTFLRQLGPSLRRLSFYYFYPIVYGHTYFTGRWDVLGLSACTNLEHLTLDLSTPTSYFDSEAADTMSIAFSAYLEILCLVPSARLRGVGLGVAVADMKNDPVFRMDWGRLEDALLRLPALQIFMLEVFFLISKYSLQPFSSRLSGLGSKLIFKISAMAPGHEIGDGDHDEDGHGAGQGGPAAAVNEVGASNIAIYDDRNEDHVNVLD